MSSDPPPPYRPHFSEGPSAPSFSPAFVVPQPGGSFPGSPYQTFPQSYAGGGDHSYYHGPPGPVGPMPLHGAQMTQPGYQGGPPGVHGAPYPSKHTVYVVDRQQEHEAGGGGTSCLAALSTVLCCCSLLPLAFQHCCGY